MEQVHARHRVEGLVREGHGLRRRLHELAAAKARNVSRFFILRRGKSLHRLAQRGGQRRRRDARGFRQVPHLTQRFRRERGDPLLRFFVSRVLHEPRRGHTRCEPFPVLRVFPRLGEVKRRQVQPHGVDLRVRVSREREEPTGPARHLQQLHVLAGRALLRLIEPLPERRQRGALHGVLPPHEERLGGDLVHLGRRLRQPPVRLPVEGVQVVVGVQRRAEPHVRLFRVLGAHFGGRPLALPCQPLLRGRRVLPQRRPRLRREAERLVGDERGIELAVPRVHVVRSPVRPVVDALQVLRIHLHGLGDEPLGGRRAGARARQTGRGVGSRPGDGGNQHARRALPEKPRAAEDVVRPVRGVRGGLGRRGDLREDVRDGRRGGLGVVVAPRVPETHRRGLAEVLAVDVRGRARGNELLIRAVGVRLGATHPAQHGGIVRRGRRDGARVAGEAPRGRGGAKPQGVAQHLRVHRM